MNLFRLAPLLLLCGFVAPLKALPDGAHGASSPSAARPTLACSGESLTITYDTTPVCNCTGAPGTIEICHEESVDVTIGSDVVSVKTGKSSSSCFSQRKENGECLYWRYVFSCCEGFWGWSCTLTQSEAKSSTSTCEH